MNIHTVTVKVDVSSRNIGDVLICPGKENVSVAEETPPAGDRSE
jgi:hypothetical protein